MGIALVIASCQGASATTDSAIGDVPIALTVEESPTPFDRVTLGAVSTLVPDRWQPSPARDGGLEEGIVASPNLGRWRALTGRTEGIAAVWVDVAEVGIRSDLYYLAARPMVHRLTNARDCRTTAADVLADNQPAALSGRINSPGDFVATGRGICRGEHGKTRWAYFVAAPGYGPIRALGIPSSGLYVVLAVVPDSPKATERLDRLLRGTRFGGTGVGDFLEAAYRPT